MIEQACKVWFRGSPKYRMVDHPQITLLHVTLHFIFKIEYWNNRKTKLSMPRIMFVLVYFVSISFASVACHFSIFRQQRLEGRDRVSCNCIFRQGVIEFRHAEYGVIQIIAVAIYFRELFHVPS